MTRKELKSLIKEVVLKESEEETHIVYVGPDKYTLSYDTESEAEESLSGYLKLNGEIIAKFDIQDDEVIKVSKLNAHKVISAMIDIITKFPQNKRL